MRIRGALLSIFVLAVAAACHITEFTAQRVEVAGQGTIKERLSLAQEVATQVWNSGLQAAAKQRFPELTEDQLRGLGIRWETMVLKSFTGEDRSPQTKVYLQCSFSHRGDSTVAKLVVDLCVSQVKTALNARLRGKAAAQQAA